MRLRTKLLISFSIMILLTGIVVYEGFDAIKEAERSRKIILASTDSIYNLTEGNSVGLRFLLTKDFIFNQKAGEFFDLAGKNLKIIFSMTRREKVRKMIDDLLLHIQKIKESNEEIKENFKILKDKEQAFVKVGIETVQIIRETEAAFKSGGFESVALSMINEFYEIRLSMQRFIDYPTPEGKQESEKLLTTFINNTKKYERTVSEPVINRALKKLLAGILKYQQIGIEFSQSALTFQNMLPTMISMLETFKKDLDVLDDDLLAAQRRNLQRSKNMLLFIALIALISGIGITILLTRNVLAQLGRDPGVLVSASKKVIDGDFNIDDKGKKLGVYGAFVDMVKNLEENIHNAKRQTEMAKEESQKAQEATARAEEAQKQAERAKRDGMLQAAGQLEGVVAVLSSASEQLSAQITQSSKGAEQQAERVAETATAMEEMNSTVLEVARNSGQASELSEQAKEKAKAGSAIVHEAGGKMTVLQEQSQVLKADMNELDQHATAISEIMSVISDIADQTNLLALNAAIEAARAGEYGRGFAVVADEVRKLAEKTMASTTDVANAITQIQESAAKNIRSVEQTGAIIEEVMEKAQAASSALTEIVTLVDNSSDQVRAIAAASEEQSATSEEINRSIAEINTISSETSQSMQEAAQAVMELSNQAQELSGLIQTMKDS